MKRIMRPASAARRGASLIICLVLLPLAVSGLTLALVAIEIQHRETARGQAKAQARLLAESAMARFLEEPARPGADSLSGELGSGRYRIEKAPGQTDVFAAIGEAPLHTWMKDAWNPAAAARGVPRLVRHRIEFKFSNGVEVVGEARSFVE